MLSEIKEKHYNCSDPQLEEIHRALIQEFEAVSRKQNEKKIILYNGLLQQVFENKYLYKFEPPNEPDKTIEPDKPYVLSINGQSIDGNIYSITENFIEIELKKSFGQLIPSLDVITDLRILLDLIDRRIVLIDREPEKFKIDTAKFLFSPDISQTVKKLENKFDHSNRPDIPHGLNNEQISAIHKSLNNKLTIIWGPPGTGKTRTLQGVIAELLANNKKVLFASNTNNAIDGLLESFTKEDKCPYNYINKLRNDGKIIRIGSQTNEIIKNVFSPNAVLEHKSNKVILQIKKLETTLLKEQKIYEYLKNKLTEYNRLLFLKDKIEGLKTKFNQIPPDTKIVQQINDLEKYKNSLLKEFSKFNPSIFANQKILLQYSQELKILKEKIIGLGFQIEKLKKDISSTVQKLNDLILEYNSIKKNVLKKLLNKEKINHLSNQIAKLKSQSAEINSQLNLYVKQQNSLIENEALITSKFAHEFNKILNNIESLNINFRSVASLLKYFNIRIKITGKRPMWLQYGIELGLCTEERSNHISFIRGFGSIKEELIIQKYQTRISDLNNQLKNNNILKSQIQAELNNAEIEYRRLKQLLNGTPENWHLLSERIESFYKNKIQPIKNKIENLNSILRNLKKTLISEAQLICCTLVKSSYDEELINCSFDVLVVDEISMVSLPQLFCASSLVSERIILSGDHLQLQPISISKGEYAKKWLKNSYFQYIENDSFKDNLKLNLLRPFLSTLSTQFRMQTDIADLVRDWYHNAGNPLKDGHSNINTNFEINGHFLNEGTIFFIDTSSINTYHSRSSDGSPYNLINSAIVAELVRELIEEYEIGQDKIFCISPYRAQYQLTWALIRKFVNSAIKVKKEISSNVHKVQGSEASIVFYDLTDGCQKGFTAFIKTSDIYIHNVAITRSKDKLVFIGDIKKLKKLKYLDPPEPSLKMVLDKVFKKAIIIDAKPYKEKIFITHSVEDLITESTINLSPEQKNNIVILASNTYYKALKKDIENAKYSIFMISPFVTRNRWEKIKPLFLNFLTKNPNSKITIITRPPDQMFEHNKINMAAVAILNEFLEIGFEVKVSKNIHAKLVVIDQGTKDAISYWGSLNPLSFSNTYEINTRLKGSEMAEKLISMSLAGDLKNYMKVPFKKDQLYSHTKEAVLKQLREFRWTLAGYYHRPFFAICKNTTLDLIIELLPYSRTEYSQIEEFKRKNFVLWNHLEEINDIISPLRSFFPKSNNFRQLSLF